MRLAAVVCLLAMSMAAVAGEGGSTEIKVDQVGYLPSSPKLALLTAKAPAQTFTIRRTADGKVAFAGKLAAPAPDADSGDQVQTADFSGLSEAGDYFVEVPGVGRSWKFSIRPDVFSRTYYLAMRAFYGQRCGTAVNLGSEFAGYSYPACHLDGRFHPSSGRQGPRPNVGGWHDAGDYGRYLPSSGIATASLLWSWEMFGAKLKSVRLNLPETGNGMPDVLNEARWNLEWMLKMQDDDGGVWHKQTSEKFADFVMPEDDHAPSVVIGTGSTPYKSTCATADLAAVAAIAARVYAPFDAKFAAQNLAAARKAWDWAEHHPDVTFKNPAGVVTGEYGDAQCGDERLWAAAELWRATGEAAYHSYFLKNYAAYLPTLQSPPAENWAQLAPMALWTYALAGRKHVDPAAVANIRTTAVAAARALAARTRASPYRVSLEAKDYVWGSNGIVANYGMQFLVANALAPDPAFVESALDNLHYLLGRNAFSLSWVTQVGENPYRHPHHRPSGADKNAEPWPGLLSGGPNANRQDGVLKALPVLPPAKIYRDDQGSYASNEVAINWQAMLAFLLAGVQ